MASKPAATRCAPACIVIAARTCSRSRSGTQPRRGQPGARAGDLDAAGDLELVAAERDDADRDAGGERLLGGAGRRRG